MIKEVFARSATYLRFEIIIYINIALGKQIPVKAGATPIHGSTKSKPLSSGVSIAAPESVVAPLGSYGSQFGVQSTFCDN